MSQQPYDPRFSAPAPPPKKKRRFGFGRLLGLLVLLFVLTLVCVPLYAWSKVDKIDAMPTGDRPAETPGRTYLLVGSDSREGLSAEERRELGTGGDKGAGRTDTIMLLHVSASGGPTALISIPRDSFVAIPGHGKNKINAAFAFGGPQLLIKTVEGETGLRIDDYVEIGFGGFVQIINGLGGVEMCLAKAIKDQKAHINLPAGCQDLDGKNALGYVRARYFDRTGDLGRVERQREMVGAVAKKALSPGTFLNPYRYFRVATSSAEALTVDRDTGPIDLFRFARAMHAVAGSNGVTLTVPVASSNYRTSAGLAVKWDTAKARALFQALKEDRTSGLAS